MADDQPPIKSENERLGNHAPTNPLNLPAKASASELVAPLAASSNSSHTSDHTVAQAQPHANPTAHVDDHTNSTTTAAHANDLNGLSSPSSHHHARNNLSFAPKDNLYEIDNAPADSPASLGGIAPTTSGTNEGYSIYSNVKDGKVSIEHQIEINVVDLFDVQSNKDISLEEVMDSLRYVMEYRIKGGRYPTLEYDIMKRLADGLLMNMGHSEKKRKVRLTEEADVAFQLFGEFLLEVQEFRQAVGEKSVSDLRFALKLDVRCGSSSTEQQQQAAVALIALLTTIYPQFSDWRELVKGQAHPEVQRCMKQHADFVKAEKMPELGGLILAPQALCFDRRIKRCLKMFRTSLETGLPSEAIPALQEHYGRNILPEPPNPSIAKMVLGQFTDFMILLLLAVAVLLAAIEEYISMTVLLIVVVLNAIIGFTQEYKAGKALDALTKLSVPVAQVLRDGTASMINSEELVPGDIVILEEGESVPADLRLAEVSQLEIIESILTGESVAVNKDPKEIKTLTRKLPLGDCKGNAFMATVVAKGRGKGIVVRTGHLTEMGKISAAIAGAPKILTPVQQKLAKLGKLLVVFALVLCAVMAGIQVAYIKKRNPPGHRAKAVRDAIITAISLAVSVIPEGLVAVTTVTMAMGVRRMATRKAIVRTLPAVETLGSVTFICSDKTGTLTEGKMGAAELWTSDGVAYGFTESTSLDPNKGDVTMKISTGETLLMGKTLEQVPAQMLISLMVSSLCNNSSVVQKDTDEVSEASAVAVTVSAEEKPVDTPAKSVEWKGVGDPTEVALVVAAQKAGFPKSYFHDLGYTRIYEQAFDSERKVMSVVYKAPMNREDDKGDHFEFVLAKGAPEEILNRCVGYLPTIGAGSLPSPLDVLKPREHDLALPVTEEFYDSVTEASGRMADNGLRVLGLAYKKVKVNGGGAVSSGLGDGLDHINNIKDKKEAPASTLKPTKLDMITAANAQQDDDDDEEIPPGYAESELVFLGMIGLIDPARAGVKESVRICKEAGITVVMITGDHIKTASAIAKELGILEEGSRAIKGEELDLLSEQAIAELKPFPNVFARVSPDNKLKLVTALQSRGESVAMTGDGVNDAPAIKAANVGVAMGIAGTDITKQAADIVLSDDNFNTIVVAVEEGRRVFENILKFIVYLLSCNCAEIFLFLLCAAIGEELPFTVIMILWANIIADVPPAMALGVEPAEPGLMKREPRSAKRGIVTKASFAVIIFQSLIMTLMTFGVYMMSDRGEPTDPGYKDAERYAQAEAFCVLTSLQLLQGFLSRTMRTSVFRINPFSNRWMIAGVLLSFVLMIMGIYVNGLNDILQLQPINGMSWVKIIICCAILIVLSEIEKLILRITKAVV
ncbi:P-type ATPase [Mortierella hygrophila]|uniref:P-type ATPase n=1 Tax=Mortierella hygrophila TaxID=979708 RepID=A0A9P6FBB6_9FUNG|nr:P-type ATPase [Mortierella hygrophila]